MKMNRKDEKYRRFYLLVGEMKNWEIALENSIWEFTEKGKGM